MPGPIRLYKYLTDAELAALKAAIIARMTNGAITATGGAAKSASLEYMDLEEQMRSVQLEYDIRTGARRAQQVVQVLTQYPPSATAL